MAATTISPTTVLLVDVRDASALAPLLAGVDLVCHQAAMVGAGVNAADAPAYGGHNDFANHGAAGPHRPGWKAIRDVSLRPSAAWRFAPW